ncbi:hypothetical protein BZG36_03650 [Bifiguratus adelaidae]|uniref:DUF410 domain-containing protein n=1 Tax=Bifiguratus adelaidae TaxID=1938954 RepID=A0A261XW23_9FUNG|nr:hypothetical protein BZG36_03650 [Bifiguratus adelaidae]
MASRGTDKQRQKLQKSVEDGNYYEAHQMYRTVARRYLAQEKYAPAIELLYSGAGLLLKHGQGGSGSDLSVYMLDAYEQGNVKVDEESLERVIALLHAYPPGEAGRKKFIQRAVTWSQKYGDVPTGDPELHDHIGTVLWKEKNYAEAEKHLLDGTDDSATKLGQLELEWATKERSDDAGAFIARAVFQYLAEKKIQYATLAYTAFTAQLPTSLKAKPVAFRPSPSESSIDVPTFKSPMINFTNFILLCVQRDAVDLYKMALEKYQHVWTLRDKEMMTDLLQTIGFVFFNIPKPKPQTNMMAEMMRSMFMGQGNVNRRADVD